MKKLLVVIMSLVVGAQAFAQGHEEHSHGTNVGPVHNEAHVEARGNMNGNGNMSSNPQFRSGPHSTSNVTVNRYSENVNNYESHGNRNDWHDRGDWHNGQENHWHNGGNGGEWRHTYHNGSLGWWFLAGGAYYLTEEAYLNSYAYNPPVVVTQDPYVTTYVTPGYVPTYVQPVQQPVYRPSTGWFCETTGMFSTGKYDTCPTPWVARAY